MKRSDFYIEVGLGTYSAKDLHVEVDKQNWSEEENKKMHDEISNSIRNNGFDYEQHFVEYLKDHEMDFKELKELSDSLDRRKEAFEQLQKEAQEELSKLAPDAPRKERMHWKNQETFAKLQMDGIEKVVELAEKEYERTAPKQSIDKVLEVLENSKTLEEMQLYIDNQELTETEKQHILYFIASDEEHAKETFDLIVQDIKNAPVYEGIEDWAEQRDTLAEKMGELKQSMLDNKNMLKELEEQKNLLTQDLDNAVVDLGKLNADVLMEKANGKEVSQETLDMIAGTEKHLKKKNQ